MIIGDKIQIGGVWWSIKIIEHLKDAGESVNGLCDFDAHEILLDKLLDVESERRENLIEEHFWHEILHVVHRKAGYGYKDDMKHDHVLVDAETPILHQIMNQIITWQVK